MANQNSDAGVQIPAWLKTSLSVDDARRIDEAVARAESKTSAEIVPMIVHRSTLRATGDRIIFWICFGFLGVGGAVSLSLLGGVDEALLDRVLDSLGLWTTSQTHFVLATLAEVVVALGAIGIAWVAAKLISKFDSMHRLVFPLADLAIEAEHRAQAEFYASDLRSTEGRTGVLLFVSMLERRAVILADEAIAKKFDSSTWTETLGKLLSAIADGKMGAGYVEAIESIGAKIAPHFPIATDDRDELANGLRIRE